MALHPAHDSNNSLSPNRGAAALVGALWAAAALMQAGQAHAAPLELYGKLPRLEDLALSPDGSRLAFVRTEDNTRVVAVMTVADRKMIGGVRMGQEKLRRLEFADDDHLMIETSVTAVPVGFWGDPGEYFQMQVYDIATHRSLSVPDTDREHGNQVNDVTVLNLMLGRVLVRRLQDHTVLFVPGLQLANGAPALALMRVDLATRDSQAIRIAQATTFRWVVDEAGELAAEEKYDNDKQQWSIAVRREGRMQQVTSGQAAIDFPELLGLGPDPGTLLVQTPEPAGVVWRTLSLADGKLGAVVPGSEGLNRPLFSRASARLIGGLDFADAARCVFFEPDMQRRWEAVLRTYASERVSLVDAAADYRRLVVRVEGQRGLRYVLVDLAARRADPLGERYDGITEIYEVRRVTYQARDGLEISAYLTLPAGKPARSLPLVVLPHGGPAAHDTADFDWWSQALASQGYAVLRPNFRGSDVDQKLLHAGFGEWGHKMQTDLSDGVRHLASTQLIDPRRVCIAGASYGGYAALAGAALDPGVYRCAVAVAGIADVRAMLERANQGRGRSRNNLQERYWDRYMGITGADDPAVDAISPIRHLDAVSIPVLLIHGRDDLVVPFEQSRRMYDALRGAHKEAQLVTLAREDHWLSRSETRLQMLQASVAFLRAHNPPDP